MTTMNRGTTKSGHKVTIYYGLSFEEYKELPGINSSRLKHLSHSALAYRENPSTVGKRPSLLGHMVHCLLLEPQDFEYRYAVLPEGMRADPRTKVYKEFLSKCTTDQEIVPEKTYVLAADIVENVENDELCYHHLNEDEGQNEVTIQWECQETGLLCKARPDRIAVRGVTDIKTTKDCTPDGFPYEAKRYGYWRQAAHYKEAVRMAKEAGLIGFDVSDDYWILAAENTGKVFCQVLYKLEPDTIANFNEARYEDLRAIKTYTQTDTWLGPDCGGSRLLEYPGLAPALSEDEDIENDQGY